MSERVRNLAPVVITLKHLKPKQRKVMADFLSKEQVRAFEEICLNIVKNTCPISDNEIQIVKRWRKPLKMMALKKYPLKEKRKVLQQGGFLGAILPVVASILGTILSK